MNTNVTIPAVPSRFRFDLHDVVRVTIGQVRTLEHNGAAIACQCLTITRRDGSQVIVDMFAANGDASALKIQHNRY